MRFAGNVIWFVLGGAIIAVVWLLGALVFAVTIVGLPLTRSAIEMAKLSAWPFGKDVVHIRELNQQRATALSRTQGIVGLIFNLIWAGTFGVGLFVLYLVAGVINCLTLIGIPFGIQSFKLAGISLWPVGQRVVSLELARAAREANAAADLEKLRGARSLR